MRGSGMSKSKIEWTEQTWNPIVGCSIVSPGCTNCYAMKTAARNEAMGISRYDGTTRKVNGNVVWTGKLAQAPEATLLEPLRRKKPTTYFVNSMGDLFHEDCPDAWIDRVFAVMALCPQHTFQVLTKRAARMRDYLAAVAADYDEVSLFRWADAGGRLCQDGDLGFTQIMNAGWPLPNVWLGVSTERQQEADERIPLLLDTAAAVRFISAEPLLGPINLRALTPGGVQTLDALSGISLNPSYLKWPALDWVIVGGESGPNARPMHPDWARGLRDQCAAAGVPMFFKQWGEWASFFDRDKDDPDWRDGPHCDNQMGRGATRFHNLAGGIGFHGERLVAMRNVGKKAAGRLLDGKLHDGMPEVAR